MRKYFVFALFSSASFWAIGTDARADTFSFAGSIQTFTVSTTGTYDITVYGAQGGFVTSGYFGGLGAEIQKSVRVCMPEYSPVRQREGKLQS